MPKYNYPKRSKSVKSAAAKALEGVVSPVKMEEELILSNKEECMNEPSIFSEPTDLSVMIERAVSLALAKRSEQLEPGKLCGVSTGESTAGKPSTAAQGLLEGVSTPSIEQIVAREVQRAVEKAMGESLPKYTAASEQVLGETQPESCPEAKTVAGLEKASGETQPKYILEAQNETRAVERLRVRPGRSTPSRHRRILLNVVFFGSARLPGRAEAASGSVAAAPSPYPQRAISPSQPCRGCASWTRASG